MVNPQRTITHIRPLIVLSQYTSVDDNMTFITPAVLARNGGLTQVFLMILNEVVLQSGQKVKKGQLKYLSVIQKEPHYTSI